jgi:hypothetical protein
LAFNQPKGMAGENWSWCDSLFMAPPAWMRLYGATGDEKYLNFAVKEWCPSGMASLGSEFFDALRLKR